MYRLFVKRMMDIVLSLILLMIFIIPMLFVSLLIKLESPGPVVFKQKRIGYKGRVFEIYKFRSMYINSENKGSGVYSGKGDPRVTAVGRFLRASSIDELPQLLNVLRGQMSFIGFRPPLTYHPWEWESYTDFQRKMFDVLPGITGWAQVHGRKNVEWNKRIEFNVWYSENMSFVLDLKIVIMTIFKVVLNKDNLCDTNTVVYEEAERIK